MISKHVMRIQERLEIFLPLTVAIFAAILAINDLFAGKYGGEELNIANQRNNVYQWYSSKGIKETITEGQIDLLNVLIKSGSLNPTKTEEMNILLSDFQKKVDKYKREKKEILLGSSQIPKTEWIQDIDGELGKVVGAKQLDKTLVELGGATEQFDLANMLFQLCLVVGSIAMVMNNKNTKWTFFKISLGTGVVGIAISINAIIAASSLLNL